MTAQNGTGVVYLDAETLAAVLTYEDAIDALQAALAHGTLDDQPPRSHQAVDGGLMVMMPAHGADGLGVKTVTIAPGNLAAGLPLIHGAYVLFAPHTLALRAILDGAALTTIRTAAVSGLIARHLARAGASRLVVFGGGVQAAAHADAMRAVRPIAHVSVIGTGSARTTALVERIRATGLDAQLADRAALADADIVCTCTTNGEPLFDAAEIAPGTLVIAVGTSHPDRRELPAALMAGALVVVETVESALAEAGDIVLAIAEGEMTTADIAGTLADVVAGRVSRASAEQRIVFKSVGAGFEDLAVVCAAVTQYEAAAALGATG